MVTDKLSTWRDSTSDDQGLAATPQESILVTAAAVAAGVLTRRALRAAWKQWRGTAPPLNPMADDVNWTDAMIWAAAVGAAAGVARVLSRRGATSAIRRYRA
ncbi:MAG: DUF4235 domain-containing protein [Planctomycetes bacterium]|nr:DUF4235 domain-containing protein [Planctomycetota bacterium]